MHSYEEIGNTTIFRDKFFQSQLPNAVPKLARLSIDEVSSKAAPQVPGPPE
jgi:hypothetical protein